MSSKTRHLKDKNPLAIHPTKRLKVITSNYMTGLVLLGSLADKKLRNLVLQSKVGVTEEGIDFIPSGSTKNYKEGQTVYTPQIHFGKDNNVDHIILEFNKMLIRIATNDGHDALFTYCKKKGQEVFDELKKQDWYAFSHIIRNTLTHGQVFNFEQSHKKWLPVSWKGRTIDSSLNGQIPSFKIYDNYMAMELLDAMSKYASTI